MNKNQSTGIIIIVAIILIALLSIAFEGPATTTSEISYSQFLNKVQLEQIESVTISKDILIATPKEEKQKTNVETKAKKHQQKTLWHSTIKYNQKFPNNNIKYKYHITTRIYMIF